MTDPLVGPEWIAAHLDDPLVSIVEVDVSAAAYDEGHIPNAVLWNAYGHMRRPDYTRVGDAELLDLIERSGIANDTTVVFYGYGAHLGYWLMRSRGHRDVRFMDGSRERWTGEWSADASSRARASYILAPPNELEASRDDVLHEGALVLDVRSQLEYDGERFWPSGAPEEKGRAGRVPGAVHVPITALRTDDGAYRDIDEMRRVFADAGVTNEQRVITYCTIGNRAAQAWFALTTVLDHPNAAVYYGSWAEWGMGAGGFEPP